MYEVVEETISHYADDEYGVIAECKTLREANEYALEHLISKYWAQVVEAGEMRDVEARQV